MSWWVYLDDKEGNSLCVNNHSEGGNYAVGGTSEATLNITYNYSKFYYQYIDEEKGLRWLDGKTGEETIERLQKAANTLGGIRSDDYWEASAGNAGYALTILCAWAKEYPDGIWAVH